MPIRSIQRSLFNTAPKGILLRVVLFAATLCLHHCIDVVQMRRSINIIESHQGRFLYKQDTLENHFIERGEMPGPGLLRLVLGDDFFTSVREAHLDRQGAAGGFAEPLDEFPAGLNDEELVRLLAGLPELEYLSLVGNNRLTDASLAEFAKLDLLNTLHLDSPHISRESLDSFHETNPRVTIWFKGDLVERKMR